MYRSYQKAKEKEVLKEPDLKNLQEIEWRPYSYVVFDEVPNWDDFFGDIHHHRSLVTQELIAMLKPAIREQYEQLPSLGIGLHVRLGDFKKLQAGQKFKEVGATRTPIPYFVDMIEQIREIVGEEWPAIVFTNGKENELADLLALPKVQLAPKNPDIIDLLFLSRSRAIVTSAGSTFGYWSGFFSEAPIIMHPDHIWGSIRSETDNAKYFEGPLEKPCPALLVERLQQSQAAIEF